MRVGIVGGGIAGLTTALALARRGLPSTVLEAAPRLESLGAGLQLAPNATRLLDRIGLLDALAARASEPHALRLRDGRDGRLLGSVPLGRAMRARYGAPYLTLARADLQATLLERAQVENAIEIRLGADVTDVAQESGGVRVMAGGAATRFDTLIAADGIHSRIRTRVLNLPGAAEIGRTAWRTAIPSEDLPYRMQTEVTVFLALRAHAVLYPLGVDRGMNVVLIAEDIDCAPAPPLQFFPAAPIRAALNERTWTRWPLLVSDPRARWIDGRIVLVGDAAHGMAPSAAQGAAQAIEDAVALADALTGGQHAPEGALLAWELARKARVVAVAREAHRNLRIYGLTGVAATARNAVLWAMPSRLHLKRLDWLYGAAR